MVPRPGGLFSVSRGIMWAVPLEVKRNVGNGFQRRERRRFWVPRRLEWMNMSGLQGSDYRQNRFASASASAGVSVERTGSQVSSVEALDWDPFFVDVTHAQALALALANPFRRTERAQSTVGSHTQNGEEEFFGERIRRMVPHSIFWSAATLTPACRFRPICYVGTAGRPFRREDRRLGPRAANAITGPQRRHITRVATGQCPDHYGMRRTAVNSPDVHMHVQAYTYVNEIRRS
jgi:hypothetical protein